VREGPEPVNGRPPNALGGRSLDHKIGEPGLQPDQLGEEKIKVAVLDLRSVEHMVVVVVTGDLSNQLRNPFSGLGTVHCLPSCAPGGESNLLLSHGASCV
jgi:hypothetical protein